MSSSFPSDRSTAVSSGKSYDWAEHLLWMEGGVLSAPEEPSFWEKWSGLILAVALAAVCFAVARAVPLLDAILLGMISGMIAGNLLGQSFWIEGSTFAVKKLLPLGVILLGVRMNFGDVVQVGGLALAMSAVVVVAGFFFVYTMRGVWKLERTPAMLLAVGTSICGGTAIVAVAPLLKAREREVIVGVSVVTLVGLVFMLLLPPLAGWLSLSQKDYGILAGLTIHQTPQVVASGFSYGDEAGRTATLVKLARVCLLAPMTILIAWWAEREAAAMGGSKPRSTKPWWKFLPGFALGFVLMALARTLGFLPEIDVRWSSPLFAEGPELAINTASIFKLLSGFLLTVGMVGVGFQTRFGQFHEVGPRPLVAVAVSSLAIALLVITVILFAA